MENKVPYLLCRDQLNKNDYENYSVYYILVRKENDNHQYFALACDEQDGEDIICLKFDDSGLDYINDVPAWEYYIDYCLLDKLEENYEIEYMPIEAHYNIWCIIDESRDLVNDKEGLQKYLSYCQRKGITKERLDLYQAGINNIMELYQEKNAGYTIIAEMKCGEHAIVLAERKNNPESFVTWYTTIDRRNGYDLGYYFSDFTSAYQNFRKRCHNMMESELSILKNRCRSKKIEYER